jgi:putative photosynthetic complex assembly protein 2
MASYALPAVYALFVWWFGTGLALYIVRLPRSTHRWSMLGAAVVLAASLCGLGWASARTDATGVYLGFTCTILLWGAIEISFLTGTITGPWRSACPQGCTPWRRAACAIGAILYHEFALLAVAAALIAATWRAPNQVGVWTFAILWVMRLSAKLNLFLGVPVLNDQLLPEPVAHLKSYFRKGPVNALFPVSVTVATLLTVLLVEGSLLSGIMPPEALMLLATLTLLALLEHWFMALPLPIEALWAWSLRARRRAPREPAPETTIAASTVVSLRGATPPRRAVADATPRDNVHPHPALFQRRRRP